EDGIRDFHVTGVQTCALPILHGRAIAGARGDQSARIFCRKFKSELVAVAGVYAVAEQMQGELRNHAVQVSLVDGKLVFNKLDIEIGRASCRERVDGAGEAGTW